MISLGVLARAMDTLFLSLYSEYRFFSDVTFVSSSPINISKLFSKIHILCSFFLFIGIRFFSNFCIKCDFFLKITENSDVIFLGNVCTANQM